ncbi:UNVERIFIED_CONTAM: hypothetical protein Sradi_3007900 [Sesamum radiatum]|uniref:Uncharacterized protein n=1 Tax=Sesamum radiatum TaxID=300843 RepID=A0AAW2S0W6_SESRA
MVPLSLLLRILPKNSLLLHLTLGYGACQTLPVNDDVFEWGPKLSSNHALELCRAVTSSEIK